MKFLLALERIIVSIAMMIFVFIGILVLFEKLHVFNNFILRNSGMFALDPQLGYFHSPHSKSSFKDEDGNFEESSINADGFRGPEIQKKKLMPRIFLLGDSVVFGHGVREQETMSSYLSNMLKLANQPAEVINGGVKGYGIDQVYQLIQKKIIQLRPDFIIWLVCSDDFENFNGNEVTLFDYDFSSKELIERDVQKSIFYISGNWVISTKKSWNEGSVEFVNKLINNVDSFFESWTRQKTLRLKFRTMTQKLAKLSLSDSFQVIYILLPNKDEISIGDLRWRSPVPILDFLHHPFLRRNWDLLFLKDGSHFTPFGNHLMAELLFQQIQIHTTQGNQ